MVEFEQSLVLVILGVLVSFVLWSSHCNVTCFLEVLVTGTETQFLRERKVKWCANCDIEVAYL